MAAKKSKTTKRAVKKIEAIDFVETPNTDSPNSSVNKKRRFMVLLGIIVLAGILYYFKGVFVVATINGKPVTRLSVIRELESKQGKQVLDGRITEELIMQEAAKKNISVTEQEISDEVKKIEENVKAQGQDLDTVLSFQGMTRDELSKQIKIQKVIEKLLSDKLVVSEAELTAYISENKDTFAKDAKAEDIKLTAQDQLRQQKLGSAFQTWITEIKASAKIQYFVQY